MRLTRTNPMSTLMRHVAIVVLLCLAFHGAANASDAEVGYSPPRGAPFFLLTDTAFGSTDEARVRLEVKSEALADVEQADGADIALYRVDQPLEFLRQQRNLHRIDLKAAARSEGLANTLSFLWTQWWLRARQTWQNLFEGKVRKAATNDAPTLKTTADIARKPAYSYPSPYKALPGLTEVSRMRYPVQFAKPIAPPVDLKLAGSSSEFMPQSEGNVMVPLGRQAPGLYVVEASIGKHRAVTLMFVSDTVAVTKTAARQFFLWAAQRGSGKPAVAEVVWSDLAGVLGSGRTDAHGVWQTEHAVPETSYAFGVDAQGGVFITENFYYDSEIYNAKLYAYTDRPLYRPGDEVNVRLYGREFTSAVKSTPLAAGPVELRVLDATGALVQQQTLAYHPTDGASARFTLPPNAPAGGYEIRLTRGDDDYSAAFRVAPYVKPHFEVLVEPAKPSFKTGDAVTGRIRLAYPDGKPVRDARLKLGARAQVLTMVEGDLLYGGLFPLQIDNDQELITNASGEAEFKLPAAKEPSRLVLSVLATDGAAMRVRATKELLVERAASAWRLQAERRFAERSQNVRWTMAKEEGGVVQTAPTKWAALHQESQTRTSGELPKQATEFTLALPRPGSYTVELRDEEDRLLGAAPFWVSGGEQKPPQGAVDVVFDKPLYRAGDLATALVTFPVVVDDALLTIERDQVEAYARLGAPGKVASKLRRLNDRQWEVSVWVKAEHAPNVTFSVAYVKGNEFGFQNAGIVVEQPSLQVALKTDKPSYAPGETVTLDIDTRDATGQPMPAVLSVGAVDEMVYTLQAELAPTVQEFFYHLRRNNVRTQSSLSFISFDEAIDPRDPGATARQAQERGVKLLERPRRDERDTAMFQPVVRTGADGKAQLRFKVPDALTRWRITAKAYGVNAADGLVGEKRAFFLSDKPFYAKWTAPTWLRAGDKPQSTLAVFNQGTAATPLKLTWSIDKGPLQTRDLDARPGASFAVLELPPLTRDAELEVNLQQAGQTVDSLVTRLTVQPVGWRSEQEKLLPIDAGATSTPIGLPADARDVRLRVMTASAASWSRIADSLIDYPYGCVEQTASRLIPLSLAVRSLGADLPTQAPVRQRLYSARLRLASMAGPDAVFGWWGNGTADNAFLSAYAYHADFMATRTLGMTLPAQHWERLLDIYGESGAKLPIAQRAWAVWLMGEIGLPIKTLAEGVVAAFATPETLPDTDWFGPLDGGTAGRDLALVLTAQMAKQQKVALPNDLKSPIEAATARVTASKGLLAQALLSFNGRDGDALSAALQRTSESEPTIDRALALTLLAKGSGFSLKQEAPPLQPKAGWVLRASASGQPEYVPSALPAPASVDWAGTSAQSLTASVRWRGTVAIGSNTLDATVTRKLMQVLRKGEFYSLEAVDMSQPLSSEALYLDEVTVTPKQALAYALVEVGLPPGASLETTTWGMRFGKDQPLERAVGEAVEGGYAVPIDAAEAGKAVTRRHLVRFAQKGSFQLPPARLWRMYQPQSQAFEAAAGNKPWQVR
jgi:uncharacterized protein YfaS (alpha-2-macroglobulin family)